VALIFLLALACLWLWYAKFYGKFTSDQLQDGEAALERADYAETERLAAMLVMRGSENDGKLLSGRLNLRLAAEVQARIQQLQQLIIFRQAMCLTASLDTKLTGLPIAAQFAVPSAVWGHLVMTTEPDRRTLTELVRLHRAHLQHAANQLTSIPRESPMFARALVPSAEALMRLREAGAATPIEPVYLLLSEAARERGDDLQLQRWLAAVCLDLNLVEEAITALEQVARLDPSDGRASRTLGLLHATHRRPGRAIEAYRQALQRKLQPHVEVETRLELARAEVATGQAAAALKTLDMGEIAWMVYPDIMHVRASAHWLLGSERDRKEARRIAEANLSQWPNHGETLVLLGRMHMEEDRPQEAAPLLEHGLRVSAVDEDLHARLGRTYQALGRTADAEHQQRLADQVRDAKIRLDELERKARARPGDAEPRLEAARLCISLGRWLEARVWLRAALACQPAHAEARELSLRVEQQLTIATPPRN
jgi:tetratricopeptide (TPR) repeat protein